MATKKPKKRNTFLGYMQSFENREPNYPSVYQAWTKKVRQDMEKEGSWFLMEKNPPEFIAEYLSRMLRLFWDSNQPHKWYRFEWGYEENNNVSFSHKRVLRFIYTRLKAKGIRDKIFYLPGICRTELPRSAWVYPRANSCGEPIGIRPHDPEFKDLGVGI